jgi:peptidoglycan/LPS O-acetylase OafA/YrhL
VISLNPTSRAPIRTGRVFVLDGLRLLSALGVVAFHLVAGDANRAWGQPTSALFAPIYHVARYGWLGVEMFFLISGFVICMSSWGRTAGEFAISRVVRLYPAYWLAVVATTAVVVLVPSYEHHVKLSELLVNLTMLQGPAGAPMVDPSYWTLTAELVFYVLFALIVVARGVTYRRVVAFCAIWTVATFLISRVNNVEASLYLGPRYSQYFVAGVAFYLIYRFGPNLLLWGIVGVSWALAMQRMLAESSIYGSPYRPTAVLVTAMFVLMAALSLGAFEWIRGRWLVVAGSLTYPLYLLHQVIGLTVITSLHRYVLPWPLLGGVVGALLVGSYLVNLVVERPVARRLKRALTRSLERLRATEATPTGLAVPSQRRPEMPARELAERPSVPVQTGVDGGNGAPPSRQPGPAVIG